MLVRERALALMARRAKTNVGTGAGSSSGGGDGDDDDDRSEDDTKPEHPIPAGAGAALKPAEAKSAASPTPKTADQPNEPKPDPSTMVTQRELPAIVAPVPGEEPWPDATPPPMRPVKPAEAETERTIQSRVATETVMMPTLGGHGRPPDMPQKANPPPLALGAVEDPTFMPGPRDIPGGEPNDPAPPPGRVPPGDSRSLRRDDEFALIYRVGTYVITRFGALGVRGQWRVVEYPTSSSASHSYAKECSRFVSEGFSDYRE